MSGSDAGGAATEEAGDACADCALADGPGCCGGHGGALLRSDRAVLLSAGIVITVITGATLSVPTSRHVLVLLVAAVTVAVAVTTSALAWHGLRGGRHGGRSSGLALRLLPLAVAGLLVTVAIAFLRSVTA